MHKIKSARAMAPLNHHSPDFIVGIDFGQTYTGVVWTNLRNTNPTKSIQDWPGLPPDSVETKVPTRIAYLRDAHNGHEPRWGFLCDPDDEYHEITKVHEHFKIYLDATSLDHAKKEGVRDMPDTVDEAKDLVTDYLRQVHQHVKLSIESITGSWYDKRVEFVFSLPTTWTSLDTANRFNDAIRAAGFMAENPEKHSAKLELTEAEAAAVFFASNSEIQLHRGDIILICDAGGGTTDLGLVEVVDPDPERPSLKQVAEVKGVGIGSTMIDRAFELLVQGRLDAYPEIDLPENLAYKLARSSSFQSIKHNFGTRSGDHPVYIMRLDKLGLDISQEVTYPELSIERGKMRFSKSEIQALFDGQIKGIISRVTRQLDWMQTHRGRENVKYLVLSGGLGGSQYVKNKIEDHFHQNRHPNAMFLRIIKSQEPRLSVVKGLVIDRRQKLTSGAAALNTRIARASYGVLCRQLYDPKIHMGEEIQIDPLNKKQKWATLQIDWLIKKGDIIDTDSAKEASFSRKVLPGDRNRQWDTTIIISHENRETLPTSFRQPGSTKLCVVRSDLRDVAESEFELMNRKPWQGKKYYLATFTVKVIIAPADLKFELWFNGTRYNRSHEPLSVDWDPAGASLRPPSRDGDVDGWESQLRL
ncbi:hsp70 family chaperone protein [Rutstroemia sp. NJR-2017a BVV2]|nr:hsp70 family chaperone protein [Rutstroemia sp. NJR-2017a BVV2]